MLKNKVMTDPTVVDDHDTFIRVGEAPKFLGRGGGFRSAVAPWIPARRPGRRGRRRRSTPTDPPPPARATSEGADPPIHPRASAIGGQRPPTPPRPIRMNHV